MFRNHHLLISFCIALLYTPLTAQFSPGNIVVLGTQAGVQNGSAMKLWEFTPDGTVIMELDVPTTGPNAVWGGRTLNLGHDLTRSPDSTLLVFSGFADQAPIGTNINQTTSSDVPRVIGTVNELGDFDRPYITSSYFSGEWIYTAATDGVNFWAGGGSNGVCYMGPGAQTVVNDDHPSTRSLDHDGSKLLSATTSVNRVGSSSTSPTSATDLHTFYTPMGTSPTHMEMDPTGTFCYTVHNHLLEKYTLVGGNWVHAYTFTGGSWLMRIEVDFSGPDPIIYGIQNTPTALVKWIDSGAPGPKVTLASISGFGYGIAFSPASCSLGASCDDGNPYTLNDKVVGVACACQGEPILRVRTYLEGAFNLVVNGMNDDLRTLPDFPQIEPYSSIGLTPTTGAGASLIAGALDENGPNSVVDWVLVEIFEPVPSTALVARIAGLIQRDGDVVALDGTSLLTAPVEPGDYRVGVRHRNHLPIVSTGTFGIGTSVGVVSLNSLGTQVQGVDPRKIIGNVALQWTGDVDHDGKVQYTGIGNDRDPILVAVGGSVPTNVITGYHQADINMDGQVSYTGLGNDRDPILTTIGGSTPTVIRYSDYP